MTLVLRPYQTLAVEKTLYEALPNNDGGGLIIMPTGTGKSVVIAEIIRRVMEFPNQRIIVATHSQELVEQDYEEFMALCPFANAGIYCAGLNSKNHTAPILFVSIQSVYDKALKIGSCDILMADEAQGISRDQDSMWGQFIADLKICNPYMRLLGLTATAYRTDSGNLIGGKDAMFHFVCYEYTLLEAIQDGYLCELIPKRMETRFDVSNVDVRGGEYVPGQLERAVNLDETTKAIIDETILYGSTRNRWIFFGAGVKHCESVAAEIRSRGITCEAITIRTKKKDRKDFIRKHKSGEIKCLVSMIVLTVGYNNPWVDLIIDGCPTQSKGRHVQKLGRGTRVVYEGGYDLSEREGRLASIAASCKPNCMVLDFARNNLRFGPIDLIKGDDNREKGKGEAPIKVCPQRGCNAVMFAGAMECPDCGYIFPERTIEIEATADDSAILSTQIQPLWHTVLTTHYTRHTKNMRDSLKVTYITTGGKFYDFVCFEHTGYAREMAAKWHRLRRDTPVPNTVGEALETWYPAVARIRTIKEGKYDRVTAVEFVPDQEVQEVTPVPAMRITDAHTARLAEFDDIPF